MRRIHLLLMLMLMALAVFCSQASSVSIYLDDGRDLMTDTDEVNVTGRVEGSMDYWDDYYITHYRRGTAYNLTLDTYTMYLEPGLCVTALNGGSPILSPASGSSWDTHLYDFDVVEVDGFWYMFYVGSDGTYLNGTGQIGLATSADGISWSRYSSNPVLSSGVDTYDYYGLCDPVLLVENGTWYMWYGGNRNETTLDIDICLATSIDGLSWNKASANPLVRNAANASAWNGTQLRPTSVIRYSGYLCLYYSANGTSNITYLAMMASSDGINWTDYLWNPIYKAGRGWERQNTRYGSVETWRGQFRMWLYADGANGWKIGYMTSRSLYSWSNSSLHLMSPVNSTSYSKHLMYPAVLMEGGRYTMYALGVSGSDVGAYHCFNLTPVRLNGTYTSQLRDHGGVVSYFYVRWYYSMRNWSRLDFQIRHGNSTDSLSPWINLSSYGYLNATIPCRYFQYRVEFSVERAWLSGPYLYEILGAYNTMVDRFAYSLDSGPYTNVSLTSDGLWSIDLSVTEGAHSLDLYAEDSSNQSANVTLTIYSDQSPPTGDILLEWGMNTTADTTMEVLLTANDTIQPVMAYVSIRSDLQSADRFYVYRSETIVWAFDEDAIGRVRLYVQYEDYYGRLSPVYNDSVIIDRSPPVGSVVINSGANYTNSTEVTLSLDYHDESGVFVMWVSNKPDMSGLDSIRPTQNLSWRLQRDEGVKTVYVWLMDSLGWMTNLTASIILDQTPPIASLSIDQGAEYASQLKVRLFFEMDDQAPMEAVFKNPRDPWPDGWEAFHSPGSVSFTLPEGDDGVRTVLMMVRDAAGNRRVVFDEIVLDMTGPVGYIEIDGGREFTNKQDVRLSIHAIDAVSGMDAMIVSNAFSFPESQWQDFEERIEWTLSIIDGEKRVYVMLRDVAGSTSILQETIVLDTVPPRGSMVIGDSGGFVHEPTVVVYLEMEDANGLSGMRASATPDMEGVEWMPYGPTFEWVLPVQEGEHCVHVQVRDAAGNIRVKELSTFLDMTDPEVSMTIARGLVATMESDVEVQWSASDSNGLDGVRFAYEPNFTGVRWKFTFTTGLNEVSDVEWMELAAEGERRFYIQVMDLSGRVSTASDTIWYIRDRPEGAIVVGDGSGWTSTPEVPVSASWVGGSEVLDYRVALDREGLATADWIPIDRQGTVTLRNLAAMYTVHAQFRGRFDILSEPVSALINLDMSAPLVQLLGPTTRRTDDSTVALVVAFIEDRDPSPSIRWRVNEGQWYPYAGQIDVPLEVGRNVIDVECTDAAGNVGTGEWTIVRTEEEAPLTTWLVAGVAVAVAAALLGLYLLRYRKGRDEE